MTVKLKHGDLLNEKTEAIVNTVNCVGAMGKGIALQFKQRWPQNFKAYESACERKEVQLGKMFIVDLGQWEKPRFLINFPTKAHWKGDSEIGYIESGLKDLVLQVSRLGIKSIALPPLGCGNGKLDWSEVKPLIFEAFADRPDVEVHLFEPRGAPPPRTMVNRTQKPNMTPARAAIIKIISIYRQMEYGLTKIEVQKLAYFLEQAGQPLKLDFVKHTYGPYSDKLRHVLTTIDGHYITGVGDFAEESDIGLLPGALSEADDFIRTRGGEELGTQVERVTNLIQGFETPYGMELLATVHWVVTQDGIQAPDEAIRAVHGWNSRKKAILQPEHIRIAWHRLNDEGWFKPAQRADKHQLYS